MNRQVRRKRKRGQDDADIAVLVVAMDMVEFYYRTQIVSEGMWNADPPVIVVRPAEEFSRADESWFQRTLAEMWQVREPGTWRIRFDENDTDLDVGLIDVRISFPAPADGREQSVSSDDNFRVFDRVTSGAVHTQMVIASAVHRHLADGSRCDHYHNLIFGLRKQIDGEQVHLGQLDFLPLVKTLGDGRTLTVIDDDGIAPSYASKPPMLA